MFEPRRGWVRVSTATLVWVLIGLAAPVLRAWNKPREVVAEPAATVPETVVGGLGRSTFALTGPWEFQLGDNAKWARPDFDDGGWERLAGDRPWALQGHPAYTGFAWYRLRLRLAPTPGAPRNFALLMPHIDDVFEVYWNGVKIGQSGKMPPFALWYEPSIRPGIFALGDGLKGVLAVRVWKAPLLSDDSGRSGGFESAPIVGYPEALAGYEAERNYEWLRSQQFAFAEYLLYALIGAASLVGWLRDRSQWMLFWMTGFSLAPLIRLVLFGMRLPWPTAVGNPLGQDASSIRDISLCFLLLWILDLHRQRGLLRLTKICAAVSLAANTLDGLITACIWDYPGVWMPQVADAVFTGLYFLTAALPLVLVAYAVGLHRRLDSARWLVAYAAFVSGMIQVTVGVAPQGSRFTHWTLAEKLDVPLFHLNGNALTLAEVAGLLLLGAIVYAVYHSSVESRRRQSALEQEFKSARELQQVLIPETLPPVAGYALTSAYRPAQEVGGDFFQIIPLEDRSTLIVLGDVSGKGLKAAMAVSLLVGLIRALADHFDSPARLLETLNARLHGRLQGGFTTCLALHLDPEGNGTLAAAGHPPPFLNGREMELPGAIPLGLVPAAAYEDAALRLRVGDSLALFTDGLLEARAASGELYGFDRLRMLFAGRPSAAAASQAAVAFGQDDDITVVVLDRVVTGAESATLHTAEERI